MYKQNRFLEIYTKLIYLHHQRVIKRILKKEMNKKKKRKKERKTQGII